MAKFTRETLELFVEHNLHCDIAGLIEWIAELLPQQDFDDYVADIMEMNAEC